MTGPQTAREALIVEAIGDAAQLLQRLEAIKPALDEACHALVLAHTTLTEQLSGFERRMAAVSAVAQTRTVKHIAARADEAAQRVIDQQGRAMADAARIAFGVELGAATQRLQAHLQPLLERPCRRWRPWLTHTAAAVFAAAATWASLLHAGLR